MFDRSLKLGSFGWFHVVVLTLMIWQLSIPALAQAQPQGSSVPAPKRVLLLYTYGDGLPAYQKATPSFLSVMTAGGINTNDLFFEYLDLQRNDSAEYRQRLADLLRHKYTKHQVGLMVTVHTDALNFLLDEAKGLFPDAPIFAYLVVRPELIEAKNPGRRILQRPQNLDMRGTLEIALKMFPETRKIVFVTGTATGDRRFEHEAKRIFEPWRDKLEFQYTSDRSVEEILQLVASLPPRSIVIYSNVFSDKTGRTFIPREVGKMVAKTANAPVFCLWDTLIGNGPIGGSLLSFEAEGTYAANVALDILNGKILLTRPVTTLTTSKTFMFDWQQLKRWGVNESILPEGSVLVNRVPTMWEQHKGLVIVGIAAFLAQTVLVIGLLIQRNLKKKAEASVQRKIEELDQFFNVSLDLMGIANTEGYFLRLNPAAERILGYTREELMFKPFLDFVHPDDVDRTREAISALASQQKVFSFENRYRCKDGTYRWLQWNSAPAGSLICAAARDVTDRKQAQQALVERLRFERLLSNLSARFVNIPPDQVDSEIEYGLRQILEFFQVDRCGLVRTLPGKTAWQITHVATAEGVPMIPLRIGLPVSIRPWAFEKLILKHEVVSFSKIDDLPAEANVDRQGYIEWGVKSTLNIPIITGEPVDHILAINSVKSERVWPEELIPRLRLLGEILVNVLERKQAEEDLKKSEERFRMLVETMKEGFGVRDENYVWTYVNDQLCWMLGQLPADIIGRPLGEFLDEANRSVLAVEIERQRKGNYSPHEITWTRTDGRKITTIVSPKPVFNREGKLKEVFAVITDITDRKRAEEALRESEERLRDITFSMADWIWEVDENGVYTYSSQKGFDLLGRSREDIIGKTPFDFMPPDEAKRVAAIFSGIAANRAPIKDLENLNIRKNGERICLLTNGVPILDEEGNLKGYRGVDKDITEQKRTEEDLQNSEEKFRQFFNNTPDYCHIISTEGNILHVNEAALKTLGYERDELVGQPLARIYAPESLAKMEDLFTQWKESGQIRDEEMVIVTRKGERRVVILNAGAVKDQDGTILHSTSVQTDITERKRGEEARKRSEKALAESQAQILALFNSTNDMIWSVDPETFGLVTFNRGLKDYFFNGLGIEIKAGMTPEELLPPKSAVQWREFYTRALRDGSYVTEYFTVARTNYHLLSINVLRRDGDVFGISVFGKDITERKRAEEALEDRLRFERLVSGLSARFENIPSEYLDLEIEQALHQILEFFRVDRCSLVRVPHGQTTWQIIHAAWAEGISPVPTKTDLPTALLPWVSKKVIEQGEVLYFTTLEDLSAEASIDKQTYKGWGIRSCANIPIVHGLDHYLVAIHTVHSERVWPEEYFPRLRLLGEILVNALERKRAEAEVARSRTELLHVERSLRLSELTASLAHELNQPLAAILSNAQAALRFLKSDKPDLNEFREIMRDIISDDQRAGNVIRSLRSMMKREEGEKRPTLLNDILNDVIQIFRSEAIFQNVHIETELDRSLPPVLGDRGQLQQVVLNIVMNAAEAMSRNPPEQRKLILRTQGKDHRLWVTARDFGPGIDRENLERVFQPFFTTKGTGLGMGLAVCSSIIKEHRGRIWAENNPDAGATFFIELPVLSDQ